MTGTWDLTLFSGYFTVPGECSSEYCDKCGKKLAEVHLMTESIVRGDYCFGCFREVMKDIRKKG